MKAEQRPRWNRSVDILPEEQCKNGQSVVDLRDSSINSPQRLFRPWQDSRAKFPNVGHVVSGAIVEKEVPNRIKASCGEEEKSELRCVDERRHYIRNAFANDINTQNQFLNNQRLITYVQKAPREIKKNQRLLAEGPSSSSKTWPLMEQHRPR